MKNFFGKIWLIIMIAAAAAAHQARAEGCSEKLEFPAEMNWRASETQKFAGQDLAPTSSEREARLARIRKFLNWGTEHGGDYSVPTFAETNKPDVYEMLLVPAEGVKTVKRERSNDTEHAIKVFGNLGPSGVFKGTLAAPVSGHNGWASAVQWAKTDLYDVWVQDMANPNDQAGKKMLAEGMKSLEVVTFQELEIELSKERSVFLMYARRGSSGVGGFKKGRIIELKWDGT